MGYLCIARVTPTPDTQEECGVRLRLLQLSRVNTSLSHITIRISDQHLVTSDGFSFFIFVYEVA